MHSLFGDVEVGFEIVFRDIHLWHIEKFSDVRRSGGQNIHLRHAVLDESSKCVHDFGALNRQSAFGAVGSDITKDHLVHILVVITDRVQD